MPRALSAERFGDLHEDIAVGPFVVIEHITSSGDLAIHDHYPACSIIRILLSQGSIRRDISLFISLGRRSCERPECLP